MRCNTIGSSAPPHTLTALSTHDTKRSEDVRARISVISELADAGRRRSADGTGLHRWATVRWRI